MGEFLFVVIVHRSRSTNSNIRENRLKEKFRKLLQHPIFNAFKNR